MVDLEKVIKEQAEKTGRELTENERKAIEGIYTLTNALWSKQDQKANRLQVMSWLEGLAEDDWRDNHSDSEVQNIAKAALELLKEQEPRVMKLEDVKAFGWDYCYLEEERLPGKEYRSVCGDYALTCITWPCIASMRIQHGDDSYGTKWRCWSAKPTDEQRRAVKWE